MGRGWLGCGRIGAVVVVVGFGVVVLRVVGVGVVVTGVVVVVVGFGVFVTAIVVVHGFRFVVIRTYFLSPPQPKYLVLIPAQLGIWIGSEPFWILS